MGERQTPEGIRCAIFQACCPKDLRMCLDMASEDFVHLDLRVGSRGNATSNPRTWRNWMRRITKDQHPRAGQWRQRLWTGLGWVSRRITRTCGTNVFVGALECCAPARREQGQRQDGGKGFGPSQGLSQVRCVSEIWQAEGHLSTSSGGFGLKVRLLLSKSRGPMTTVSTLKKDLQHSAIRIRIHDANCDGSSLGVCSKNDSQRVLNNDEDDVEQCARQFLFVARTQNGFQK